MEDDMVCSAKKFGGSPRWIEEYVRGWSVRITFAGRVQWVNDICLGSIEALEHYSCTLVMRRVTSSLHFAARDGW